MLSFLNKPVPIDVLQALHLQEFVLPAASKNISIFLSFSFSVALLLGVFHARKGGGESMIDMENSICWEDHIASGMDFESHSYCSKK